MGNAGWVALALAAMFGAVAPALARRVTPRAGTWLLSVGAAVAGLSAAMVLALVAMPLVAMNPEVAEHAHWSVIVLRRDDPLARSVGAVALLLLGIVGARFVVMLVRRLRALRACRRACRTLPAAGDLVVVPESRPDAYAVPGRPGRIVMTRGMLRALTAREHRAVLAHERAHLRHRHHLHLLVAALASTLNPALVSIPAALRLATERWADQEAARVVGRDDAAAALAHAARVSRSGPRPEPAMGIASHEVDARLAAMQQDGGSHGILLVVGAVMVVLVAAATLLAADRTAELFHLALSAAARLHHH